MEGARYSLRHGAVGIWIYPMYRVVGGGISEMVRRRSFLGIDELESARSLNRGETGIG